MSRTSLSRRAMLLAGGGFTLLMANPFLQAREDRASHGLLTDVAEALDMISQQLASLRDQHRRAATSAERVRIAERIQAIEYHQATLLDVEARLHVIAQPSVVDRVDGAIDRSDLREHLRHERTDHILERPARLP